MERVSFSDVRDLVAWEKLRDAERARIIELKKSRRVQLGENISLLFENRDTVLFQVQEMARTERIVEEGKLRDELAVYNALIPGPGELSATLFIEIPDLHRLSQEQVRLTVNRFQGLEQQRVWLVAGEQRIPARFEAGHSKEEKMAAVHYVRFSVPPAARAALASESTPARLVVDHPAYKAEAGLTAATRAALLADLT
jgi:hypothetical protein